MRNYISKIMAITISLMVPSGAKAQNIRNEINEASSLMREGKYNEAYNTLQRHTDKQAEEYSDTCAAYFNYYKGSCLYYLKKYEEAIPCLKKGIQVMDKMHYRNCDYFEMLYGIGVCHMNLKSYAKAEEYFRRTILKGDNNEGLNCAIRNQTYRELADLYIILGKQAFADICISKIGHEMKFIDSQNTESQISSLLEQYFAYDKQGKYDECVIILRAILRIVEENNGKNNKDYLSYSNLLGMQLMNIGRGKEAAEIHKEIIEIGSEFKTFNIYVGNAYNYYLSFLADNGKVDSIELILPMAERYFKSGGDSILNNRNLYEMIGISLFEAKKYEDGVRYLEKKWNGKSANSIRALNYLGNYYESSEPSKALSFYKEIEIRIKNGLEVEDNTKQTILQNLMFTNERLGNFQEAIKYAELLEPFLLKSKNDDFYLSLLHIWAADCINANNPTKAKEVIGKCEPLLDKVSNDVKIGAYSNMGFVYLKLGQYEKAIENIDKGIELARKEGDGKTLLATLYHNLGRSYMLINNFEKALSALNKSKELQLELEGRVMQRTADYINECLGK